MSGEGSSLPVMAIVSTYIKKEHVGAPFAPALLSSLLYLVGTDVTELVVVVLCFVVARWKGVTLTQRKG